MSKDTRPIYPPQENGEFDNYISKTPFAEDYWQDIQEAEKDNSQNKKIPQDYMMELGEEITFEDLNEENLKDENIVDIDSIINNLDMSDHSYRDNIW